MKEGAPSLDYYSNLYTSRKENIEYFIKKVMTLEERETAAYFANDLFKEHQPLAKTVVLIPVAAHQEHSRIYKAMNEYAKQVTEEPFSVVLFLNTPDELADSNEVKMCLEEVEKAKDNFTDLDIRSTFITYQDFTIGMVRRDLWNTAILLAHHEGIFDAPGEDVIGLNHDIDVEYISPNYIARVQAAYKTKQNRLNKLGCPDSPLPPATTLVRHALPVEHPNLAKGVFWADFSLHQLRKFAGFEASLVVPFSFYTNGYGFDPESKTYETNTVYDNTGFAIPSTVLKTSPRRYLDRLPEFGFGGIWSDESFSQNDECRTKAEYQDITFEKLEELIFDSFEDTIGNFFSHIENELSLELFTKILIDGECNSYEKIYDLVYSEVNKKVNFRKRLAKKALGEVIESPILVELVDQINVNIITENITARLVENMRDLAGEYVEISFK